MSEWQAETAESEDDMFGEESLARLFAAIEMPQASYCTVLGMLLIGLLEPNPAMLPCI